MEWIKSDDERKPEVNKIYWVTTIIFGNPIVVEAQYSKKEKWFLIDGSTRRMEIEVEGWWNSPRPEPMYIQKNKPVLTFQPYEVNKNGLNTKIKVNLLHENKMRNLGFTDHRNGYWCYTEGVTEDITLSIVINKSNPDDFRIDVLEDDYCQPYDYQRLLSQESYKINQLALKVYNKVEETMERLSEEGIISGHVKGEYI